MTGESFDESKDIYEKKGLHILTKKDVKGSFTTIPRSIFPYPGNKKRDLQFFFQYIPSCIETFIDPFCGSLSTLVYCHDYVFGKSGKFFVNDTYEHLIMFFQKIQDGLGPRMFRKLQQLDNTKDWFDLIRNFSTAGKNVLFDPNEDHHLDLATRFFYLRIVSFNNHVQFNKKQTLFTSSRDNRVDYNVTLKKYHDLFNTDTIRSVIKHGSFTSMDYLQFLNSKKVEPHLKSPKTFLYLDPPFLISNHKYYNSFGMDDYNKLNDFLRKPCVRCHWVLTIPHMEETHALFRDHYVSSYTKTFVGKITNPSHNVINVYKS